MQEFSSVIASSYDAESLAPMLTEKAAEGWSVVSIVSAGTNVIAYLTRGAANEAPAVTAPAAIVGTNDVVATAPAGTSVAPEPVEAVPEPEPEPVVETAVEPVPEPEPVAAAEPEPEPVVDTVAEAVAPGDAVVGLAGGIDDTVPADDVSTSSDAAPDTEVTTDATDESAAGDGSGVPAGWYADPSGRYELRYWDGAAWTEHVSRAGQQYTDPPVA
jgi:hypothetical protein